MKQTYAARKTDAPKIPELHNGDRLSRDEFMRRYEAMGDRIRAELIGGIVYMSDPVLVAGNLYMPSPVRREHGVYHLGLSIIVGNYQAATPGTEGGDNLTALLDENRAPQPDLLLRILTECGGQSSYNDKHYLVGAPEWLGEIAHSSSAIDLGEKLDDYREAGVLEYFVLCVEEQELHWFHFPSKRKLKPNAQGIYKSRIFPGLWIDGPALLARDSAKLLATIQEGCGSKEHAAFLKKLQRKHRK